MEELNEEIAGRPGNLSRVWLRCLGFALAAECGGGFPGRHAVCGLDLAYRCAEAFWPRPSGADRASLVQGRHARRTARVSDLRLRLSERSPRRDRNDRS